ncbi:benzaldehyde dehydrogenase [Pseudomonas aeruginosa]
MKQDSSYRLTDSSHWSGKIFNGDWVPARGGVLKVAEPASGELLYEVGQANAEDAVAAIEQASKAQKAWASMAPRDRAAVLRRAGQILEEEAEQAALLVARETGGIEAKGRHEINEAIVLFYQAAAMPLQAQGQVLPSKTGRLSFARRRPLGVVGVISPFNFPLVLGLRSVAPALAVGNAVVLKPDPRTPFAGGIVVAAALERAGLPKGVLHVLPGFAEPGQTLVEHPGVQMIAFTGSTAAGRKIGEIAGKHLKKVSLELGGKNPLIVLDDADLDKAASAVAFGAYFHQGQICMATGRVLVQRSIAESFTQRLVAKARALKAGNPAKEAVALGPIIDQRQIKNVIDIVDASVAAGAKLEAGGTYEGLFYAPTVLSNVQPGMRAYDEEVFGPVINIITFDSDDEAVEIANATEYGLSAGVLSGSTGRAIALAQQLDAGMVHINDQTVGDEVVNPFGGTGASGNGTSVGGPADWEEYTHWQWLTIDNDVPAYPF